MKFRMVPRVVAGRWGGSQLLVSQPSRSVLKKSGVGLSLVGNVAGIASMPDGTNPQQGAGEIFLMLTDW